MERLLLKGKGGGPKRRRIFEPNPDHEIFIKLRRRYDKTTEAKTIGAYAELMPGCALLAEGSELVDPVRFNHLFANMILQTL